MYYLIYLYCFVALLLLLSKRQKNILFFDPAFLCNNGKQARLCIMDYFLISLSGLNLYIKSEVSITQFVHILYEPIIFMVFLRLTLIDYFILLFFIHLLLKYLSISSFFSAGVG